MIHRTYNEFHLGDNLVHLHFLRALARKYPGHEFIHAVQECHMEQLSEAVADVAAIKLIDLATMQPFTQNDGTAKWWMGADGNPWRNTWKNAYRFWESHPQRHDFLEFHRYWFALLAGEMGLESPLRTAADFLFDYPALRKGWARPYDFLIVNSQPCSGQLKSFDSPWYFEPLIADLAGRGSKVICTHPTHVAGVDCTQDYHLTLSGIGHLSQCCTHHIMVATGPMWPTLNVFNQASVQTRVVLLDHILGPETVNVMPHSLAARAGTIVQVPDLAGVRAVLKAKGLL